MGRYELILKLDGTLWAMAQDHFEIPPDPKRTHLRPKKSQTSLKVRARPAKFLRQTSQVSSAEP